MLKNTFGKGANSKIRLTLGTSDTLRRGPEGIRSVLLRARPGMPRGDARHMFRFSPYYIFLILF
jgi:hypothetical protein